MSGIRLDTVGVRHGEVTALADLTLTVEAGELLVVLGPTGAGKSTLLRAIAGLVEVTGRVSIGDRDVTNLPPGRRSVAMVFQQQALFPHLDVAGNIAFGLTVRRERDVAERVVQAAEAVDCAHLLARRPSKLSGGERQRVALARALVGRPDVLLLDEPMSNLDAESRLATRVRLRELHERTGTTAVHVTHDQTEALALGDRIAILRDGRLEQIGTPSDIWHRPVNRSVARFVGTTPMNLLPGDGPLPGGRAGQEIGVRPESIRLGDSGVPALVRRVEVIGADVHCHLDLAGHRVLARLPSAGAPAVEDEVLVSATEIHVFDADTGRRVE